MKKIIAVLTLCTLTLTGCSVYMTANKHGTDTTEIQKPTIKFQMLGLGGKVVSSRREDNGNLVEVYQISTEKGSAARALLHGFLDKSCAYLWTLLGTPKEMYLSKDGVLTLRLTYDKNDVLIKAEII